MRFGRRVLEGGWKSHASGFEFLENEVSNGFIYIGGVSGSG